MLSQASSGKRATHLDEANNLADRDRLALVAKGEPTQLRVVLERLDAHRLSSLNQRNDLHRNRRRVEDSVTS